MNAIDREARILSLDSLVRACARARKRQLPDSVDLDDLRSAAWLGAIAAVDRFDEKRGTPLPIFAESKIKGAILDYLRKIDPLTRNHRQDVSRAKTPNVLTFSLDQRAQHKGIRRQDPEIGETDAPARDVRSERAIAEIEARLDLAKISARALDLAPRKLLIWKRWASGERMGAIGRSLTPPVTEGRVSRICTETRRKLRAAA